MRSPSASDSQAIFDSKFAAGFYPPRIEGAQTPDGSRYRATFVKLPARASFFSYIGMNQAVFARRESTLTQLGYRVIWTQTFIDADGNKRIQATWMKD